MRFTKGFYLDNEGAPPEPPPDNGQQGAPPEPKKPPPEPKKPPPGDDDKGPIPYNRFAEVVEERNNIKAQLEQLQKAQEAQTQKELEEQNKYKELYEQTKAKYEAQALQQSKLEIALSKGLPVELANRLQGSTPEELEADADKLLPILKQSGPGTPPPSKGGKTSALDISNMSPEEIRKNREALLKQARGQ